MKPQACLDYQGEEMWNAFIRSNLSKELIILTRESLTASNIDKININGESIRNLANEVLEIIGLPKNSDVFNQQCELNQNISNGIRRFLINRELNSLIRKHETN